VGRKKSGCFLLCSLEWSRVLHYSELSCEDTFAFTRRRPRCVATHDKVRPEHTSAESSAWPMQNRSVARAPCRHFEPGPPPTLVPRAPNPPAHRASKSRLIGRARGRMESATLTGSMCL